MPRPKKTDSIDLSKRASLTTGAIERLTCPPDKPQAFMRDSEVPSLRVRVTPSGAKSFVFEAKLNRQTIRRTIGSVTDWDIPKAREEARRLAVMLDGGIDPREVERQQQAEREATKKQQEAQAVTAGDVWPIYLEKGRPKRKDAWKPRYLADMRLMASQGGEPKKRGQGVTRRGPIYPLLALPLASITEDVLGAWFEDESRHGRYQATRALMMFRGFLRWCAARPEYRPLVNRDAGKSEFVMESLPPNTKRTDRLDAAMLPAWWQAVEQLPNTTASVYIRALLLTGARREELAALTWENVDFRWRKLRTADKVAKTRVIPMCDYMAHLLGGLPRIGPYVFASASKKGYIADPRHSHDAALQAAGIEHLTFHGLRRSFSVLAEQAGIPDGAIRQVMGHSVKDAHEGYKVRSIGELQGFLQLVERFILEQAGISFTPSADTGRLRVVA